MVMAKQVERLNPVGSSLPKRPKKTNRRPQRPTAEKQPALATNSEVHTWGGECRDQLCSAIVWGARRVDEAGMWRATRFLGCLAGFEWLLVVLIDVDSSFGGMIRPLVLTSHVNVATHISPNRLGL